MAGWDRDPNQSSVVTAARGGGFNKKPPVMRPRVANVFITKLLFEFLYLDTGGSSVLMGH